MAFTAKNGKKFGNRQQQQKYDSMHSEPAAESEGAPTDLAAQHGAAQRIEITKGKGTHHVVAHHPDGHISRSQHATASEALDEARNVSGANEEATESPEFEAGEMEGSKEPMPMPKKSIATRIPGV